MSSNNTRVKSLDEAEFMRGKLHGDSSAARKYADLVLASYSPWKLFKYELVTSLLGHIPGAVGLVLRKIAYRSLFNKIGRNVVFGRSVTIRCPENIVIGDNVIIDNYCLLDGRGAGEEKLVIGDNVVLNRGCIVQSKSGFLHIGDYSTIGAGSAVVSQGGVKIGRWVGIAGGCEVSGGLFEHCEPADDSSPPFVRYSKGPVTIGDNSILAYGAIVVDNVTVGNNCMIGAGCLVINDLPDNSIASSRPAVVLAKKPATQEEIKNEAKNSGTGPIGGGAGYCGHAGSTLLAKAATTDR